MLLKRFDLHRPTTLPALFELIDRFGEDAAVYAGGTELLIALKARVLHYPHLIDLKAISSLGAIALEDDHLVIGALATHHRIAADKLVQRVLPAYAELSNNIANIRVRCAGTLGGNLCFAEPHADPPALLAALGAKLRLQSLAGSREVAMADFIHGDFETDRQSGEILSHILVPLPMAGQHAAYRSYGAGERPVAGGAVVLELEHGICRSAALWIGAVAGRPLPLPETAAALIGLRQSELLPALETTLAAEIGVIDIFDDAHGSADYKRHLAATMLRRALAAALTQPEASHA
ncbi:FAD binding domain-containing protein [Ferrovibrio sp.]|uniref:FAD binding domain-containing protein n=1 Tax=Ferrovibrio sp. TaxID=1917215 RepID=UPI001B5701D2|nr:FAD binding domain-containing protein [Ferrovibrio sp.]MBP7063276.1 FAD binding domain-containing protein [Ferrovibrio sp.]